MPTIRSLRGRWRDGGGIARAMYSNLSLNAQSQVSSCQVDKKESALSIFQSGYFMQSKPRQVKIYSLSIRYISVTMRILCLQHVVLVMPIKYAPAVSVIRHR